MTKCGELYIVSTPIGNLEDITLRALRILKEVDLIAAEDTRHSKKLLNHYAIMTPICSYYQHNQLKSGDKLLRKLMEGQDVALISDAGTPGISDPGSQLVKMALEAGIAPIVIPGPCAGIAALVVSGLPTARFIFEAYLPHSKKGRRDRLAELTTVEKTLVFYLSPHRLIDELTDIYTIFGEREAVLAREITKRFEEMTREPLSVLINSVKEGTIRGEYTLVLAGHEPQLAEVKSEEELKELLLDLINEKGLSKKEAVAHLAKEQKMPKKEIYKIGVKLCQS